MVGFHSSSNKNEKPLVKGGGLFCLLIHFIHSIYWFIQIFTILFSHCPQIAKAILSRWVVSI